MPATRKAYFHYPMDAGCPYMRVLLPARHCADHFPEWEFDIGPGFPGDHDVYFFHGLPADANQFLDVIHVARTKKLVWGVDDDWLTIPEWNPAKPKDVQLALYHTLKHVAHHILCSTPALGQTFVEQGFGDKVLVAPNLLDLSRFPHPPMEFDTEGNTFLTIQPKLPVRVVWSGGPTHRGDVGVLEEPLEKLLGTYGPDKVVVVFNGMTPPSKLLRKFLHKGLFHQPMSTFTNHQQILNSIDPHVYLAPLAKVPFNLSKSNLRIIEGWALCCPSVATDFGEYSCVHNGHDGRLVDTPEQWYSAIHRMVFDHEYRVQQAVNGRLRVQDEYDWNNDSCDAKKAWYAALSKVFEGV